MAVRAALDELEDWGPSGTKPGQYRSDLVADAAALAVLGRRRGRRAVRGVGAGRRRSGRRGGRRPARRQHQRVPGHPVVRHAACAPWTGTARGPRSSSTCRTAARSRPCGAGARRWTAGRWPRPGARCPVTRWWASRACRRCRWAGASSGRSGRRRSTCARWPRARSTGSWTAARRAHGAWDYLGGALICAEAGAPVVDVFGRDLVVLDHAARRTPVAAATPALLDALVVARRRLGDGPVG